jgi:catechol O-methyltransferase
VLELGTYCGYSSIRIANNLKEGSILISMDINEKTTEIAEQVSKLAGLENRIQY